MHSYRDGVMDQVSSRKFHVHSYRLGRAVRVSSTYRPGGEENGERLSWLGGGGGGGG